MFSRDSLNLKQKRLPNCEQSASVNYNEKATNMVSAKTIYVLTLIISVIFTIIYHSDAHRNYNLYI